MSRAFQIVFLCLLATPYLPVCYARHCSRDAEPLSPLVLNAPCTGSQTPCGLNTCCGALQVCGGGTCCPYGQTPCSSFCCPYPTTICCKNSSGKGYTCENPPVISGGTTEQPPDGGSIGGGGDPDTLFRGPWEFVASSNYRMGNGDGTGTGAGPSGAPG